MEEKSIQLGSVPATEDGLKLFIRTNKTWLYKKLECKPNRWNRIIDWQGVSPVCIIPSVGLCETESASYLAVTAGLLSLPCRPLDFNKICLDESLPKTPDCSDVQFGTGWQQISCSSSFVTLFCGVRGRACVSSILLTPFELVICEHYRRLQRTRGISVYPLSIRYR